MAASKQERQIFAVTGSTGLADRGWSELLRRCRSVPAIEAGIADGAIGQAWNPRAIVAPIVPEIVRHHAV